MLFRVFDRHTYLTLRLLVRSTLRREKRARQYCAPDFHIFYGAGRTTGSRRSGVVILKGLLNSRGLRLFAPLAEAGDNFTWRKPLKSGFAFYDFKL